MSVDLGIQTMRTILNNLTPKGVLRRTFIWAAQLAVFAGSGVLSFQLRFDFSMPADCLRLLLFAVPVWMVVKTTVFRIAKLDRGLWEYFAIGDLIRLAVFNLASSAVSCALIVFFGPGGFPRSVYFLDLLLCFTGTAGVRIGVWLIKDAILGDSPASHRKRTLIYGAGYAGSTLLKEIRNNPKLAYLVCGFLDDNAAKRGMRIDGITVLGGGETLESIVLDRHIEMILIGIPSASGRQMTRILGLCHDAGVECRTVPGLADVIEAHGLVGQIREVAVEDLLARTPVHLEEGLIRTAIEGKIVLVTGAAGSIGSELCRQIARFRPAGIVGFEMAESPLFEIDLEMRTWFPNVPFFPEVGNIRNRARLDEVLRHYKPRVVFHAAAYKHVPLMETHVFEAIENNVFGTCNLAMAAAENEVEEFVMLSTDKAVHPTSVMGASKRVAELLLQHMQNGGTQFIMVRFGNVLGSKGSVIPIFKKQISEGGPVKVTHPDMRRYFMTIPEACQLVLQASAIGEGGQICVLDMGQPVKIADLAKNLILLSGLRPHEDIKIEYTGIRPGEKLYEELSSLMEDTVPSQHEKVRIFVGRQIPDVDFLSWLDSLQRICDARDIGRLLIALKQIVVDYNPSMEFLERVVGTRSLYPAAMELSAGDD
jgi:FlaA1/EpsC-like NDP-sugar epimerase